MICSRHGGTKDTQLLNRKNIIKLLFTVNLGKEQPQGLPGVYLASFNTVGSFTFQQCF